MTNAADRKSVRAAEKASRLVERQRHEVVANQMSTTAGRAYIHDQLTRCHIFSTTFIPGAPDITGFNEGQRSIGLQLLGDLMAACPDQYIVMMREANARSTAAERPGNSDGDGGDQGSGAEGGDAGGED